MARIKIHLDVAGDLPPICVCCGKPATRTRQQEFPLNTARSAALLLTGAVLGAIVWTQRGITLTLPVCDYHRRRGRRSNRTFFHGMALTLALGVAAYLGSYVDDTAARYLGVASMFAFIVTMVVGMHEVNDGLAVKSLTSDSFTLTGIHPKFVEAAKLHNSPQVSL